jgi:cellulose synthase/poly-beta-1,6-N-acetylglucosamine synthase-like glycosyltransferase
VIKLLRVAVVIPAHNEQYTIAGAVRDIASQTYKVSYIVVVNDCSTDNTAQVLESLRKRFPSLVVITNTKPALRAGAINCGLSYLADKGIDIVFASDADSRFDQDMVKHAVRCFVSDPLLGGVCTTSGVLKPDISSFSLYRRPIVWLLWRLHRLCGADFDATRTGTWKNVQILHGLCSAFRLQAVLNVGCYSPNHMLEDYDLTLKLKKAGWQTMYCPAMKAWTSIPVTFKAFFRRWSRWMRGGVDIILEHGIDKYTAFDTLNHVLFLILLLGIVTSSTVSLIKGSWHPGFSTHPLPIALAVVGYICSLSRLRYLDDVHVGDIVVRALLFPELIVSVALSYHQLKAYFLSVFKCSKRW